MILLERGSVFQEEYLHIYEGGTREHPVVVDAYGQGEMPVIAAEGSGLWYQNYGAPLDSPAHVWKGYVSSAVLLYDAEYITVRNIEITNSTPGGRGVQPGRPDGPDRRQHCGKGQRNFTGSSWITCMSTM